MKTKTIEVFALTELSEEAQQTAYNQWLSDFDYGWSVENRQTLEAFADVFPVSIRDWSYGDRGAGVSFSMTCDGDIEDLSGVRLAKYIWNNYRLSLFRGKYFGHLPTSGAPIRHKRIENKQLQHGENKGQWMHFYKSGLILSTDCVLTGFHMDNYILDPIYKFLGAPNNNTSFRELMEECFNEWVSACERDLEDAQSFERFQEDSEANGWTYRINGKMENV